MTNKVTPPLPKPQQPQSQLHSKPPLENHPSSKYPSSTTKLEFEAWTTITCSRSSTKTTTTLSHGIIELLEGHPLCNIVEIIFHTSWGPIPSWVRLNWFSRCSSRSFTRCWRHVPPGGSSRVTTTRRTSGASPVGMRSCGFIALVSLRMVGPTTVVVVHGYFRRRRGQQFALSPTFHSLTSDEHF